MKINIHTQHFTLEEAIKERIQAKAERLAHFAGPLHDESAEVRIELEQEASGDPNKIFQCRVTVIPPKGELHAEGYGLSAEAAMDETVEKLKKQIERYKAKREHLDERPA